MYIQITNYTNNVHKSGRVSKIKIKSQKCQVTSQTPIIFAFLGVGRGILEQNVKK